MQRSIGLGTVDNIVVLMNRKCTGWFKLNDGCLIYSPANFHAVSSIRTVKSCSRLLCAVAKTSPVQGFLFFLFLPDFCQLTF